MCVDASDGIRLVVVDSNVRSTGYSVWMQRNVMAEARRQASYLQDVHTGASVDALTQRIRCGPGWQPHAETESVGLWQTCQGSLSGLRERGTGRAVRHHTAVRKADTMMNGRFTLRFGRLL